MLYFLNIILGCFYLSFVKIMKWKDLWKLTPIMLLWAFIAGGQDNIGADYPAYYHYFNHIFGAPETRFEWLFTEISDFTIKCGFYGQGPFYIFAFINILLIFIGAKVAKISNWGIFYFLIITAATIFNNQMNAVRQTGAVALCFIAFIEFYDKKWLGIALILLAAGFHYSVLVCLPFFLLKQITDFTKNYPISLLLISFVSAFIDGATQDFNNYLLDIMPEAFTENTHYDEAYKDSVFNESTNIIYRLSKVIMIPLYWKSLMLIKKNYLNEHETNLFNLGFLSFMLRNLLLLNQLTGRISYYFWIPSIFPLYYLMRYYWQNRDFIPFIIITAWLIIPYIIKIIVGTQNYADSFIYFK